MKYPKFKSFHVFKDLLLFAIVMYLLFLHYSADLTQPPSSFISDAKISSDGSRRHLLDIEKLPTRKEVLNEGTVLLWAGNIDNIPCNWALCNGENSTPNLTDRFIISAGHTYKQNSFGGADEIYLSESQLPPHLHSIPADAFIIPSSGAHSHIIPDQPIDFSSLSVQTSSSTHSHAMDFDSGNDEGDTHTHAFSTTATDPSGHTHPLSGTLTGGSHTHPANTGSDGAHEHTIPQQTTSSHPGHRHKIFVIEEGSAPIAQCAGVTRTTGTAGIPIGCDGRDDVAFAGSAGAHTHTTTSTSTFTNDKLHDHPVTVTATTHVHSLSGHITDSTTHTHPVAGTTNSKLASQNHRHNVIGNTLTDGMHSHDLGGILSTGTWSTSIDAAHTHDLTLNNDETSIVGEGEPINILPPYYALAYICKVKPVTCSSSCGCKCVTSSTCDDNTCIAAAFESSATLCTNDGEVCCCGDNCESIGLRSLDSSDSSSQEYDELQSNANFVTEVVDTRNINDNELGNMAINDNEFGNTAINSIESNKHSDMMAKDNILSYAAEQVDKFDEAKNISGYTITWDKKTEVNILLMIICMVTIFTLLCYLGCYKQRETTVQYKIDERVSTI